MPLLWSYTLTGYIRLDGAAYSSFLCFGLTGFPVFLRGQHFQSATRQRCNFTSRQSSTKFNIMQKIHAALPRVSVQMFPLKFLLFLNTGVTRC